MRESLFGFVRLNEEASQVRMIHNQGDLVPGSFVEREGVLTIVDSLV